MVGIIVGGFLIAIGLMLVFKALPFVQYAARRWPRSHSRGSADLLASSAFFNRFVGLALTLSGIGLILFEVIPQ